MAKSVAILGLFALLVVIIVGISLAVYFNTKKSDGDETSDKPELTFDANAKKTINPQEGEDNGTQEGYAIEYAEGDEISPGPGVVLGGLVHGFHHGVHAEVGPGQEALHRRSGLARPPLRVAEVLEEGHGALSLVGGRAHLRDHGQHGEDRLAAADEGVATPVHEGREVIEGHLVDDVGVHETAHFGEA